MTTSPTGRKEYPCEACGETTRQVVRQVQGFEIIQCGHCGLRFVPPDAIKAVDYDQLYSTQGDYSYKLSEERLKTVAPAFPKARRVALEKIRQLSPRTLLEIGCGTGDFLVATEAMGIKTWGTDLSKNALAAAQNRVSAQLHCGLLSPDVFKGQTFDAACSWEVLEHVPSASQYIQTIWDRLNAGGFLFLSTPNYESRYVWDNMPLDARSRPPVHVAFWNKKSLETFLQRSGFDQVSVERLSIPASTAMQSGKLLDRWLVYPDSLLRPVQRFTLLAIVRKPAQT